MSNNVETVEKETVEKIEKKEKILTPLKKALRSNAIGSLVCLVIGAVAAVVALSTDTDENGAVAVIAGFIGLIFILTSLLMITIGRVDVKRHYCKYCGEKYDYEADVSWSVVSEDNNGQKIVATVEFECDCGNCGEQSIFSKKFTTAQVIENKNTGQSSVRHYNLKNMVKKYMK